MKPETLAAASEIDSSLLAYFSARTNYRKNSLMTLLIAASLLVRGRSIVQKRSGIAMPKRSRRFDQAFGSGEAFGWAFMTTNRLEPRWAGRKDFRRRYERNGVWSHR